MSQYCEWEWSGMVSMGGCSMEKVQREGNYTKHQCGISFIVTPGHRGVWICELEKYHLGFTRR